MKVEAAVPPEGRNTVPGLNVSEKPEIGDADSTTLPENPPRLVSVIVDVLGAPVERLIVAGLAEIAKSGVT